MREHCGDYVVTEWRETTLYIICVCLDDSLVHSRHVWRQTLALCLCYVIIVINSGETSDWWLYLVVGFLLLISVIIATVNTQRSSSFIDWWHCRACEWHNLDHTCSPWLFALNSTLLWCSNCPPSARMQARRRVCHWFTATKMMLWSKSHHSSISRSIKWLTSFNTHWQCWRRQFSTIFFYKKQYLSNRQAVCRESSHKHCK